MMHSAPGCAWQLQRYLQLERNCNQLCNTLQSTKLQRTALAQLELDDVLPVADAADAGNTQCLPLWLREQLRLDLALGGVQRALRPRHHVCRVRTADVVARALEADRHLELHTGVLVVMCRCRDPHLLRSCPGFEGLNGDVGEVGKQFVRSKHAQALASVLEEVSAW